MCYMYLKTQNENVSFPFFFQVIEIRANKNQSIKTYYVCAYFIFTSKIHDERKKFYVIKVIKVSIVDMLELKKSKYQHRLLVSTETDRFSCK